MIEQIQLKIISKLKKARKNIKDFTKQVRRYFQDRKEEFSLPFFKRLFIKIIVLFFLCWIYRDIESDIRELIVKYANDTLLFISNFIKSNKSVNTFIAMSICVLCYVVCHKLWINIYCTLWRFVIGIFLLYILLRDDFWNWEKLPLVDVNYKELFVLVICIILLTSLSRMLRTFWHSIIKYKIQGKKDFLTNDELVDIDEQSVRKCYAQSVVNQLLNTDTKNESYALAVTGEWGSGKSTFLMCMKEEIIKDKKAYVMTFNPWNSMSPQTLILDFFQQLNNFVSPLYSPLEKTLFTYAYTLTKIDVNPNINQILKLIPNPAERSLDKLKNNVEKGLKHIGKPITIIIDDIDRLEKEELFEILRLIRNTGNFTNLIYIVAYDEKYVVQQLKQKGIYDEKLFLEKIFPAQISLPKADLTEVYDVFKHELRLMSKGAWVNSCIDRLKSEEIENIRQALYSFRRAKHFARQLSLSANFLYDKLGPEKFSLHDLLFIELIHYLSPSLYEILTNNPRHFLTSGKIENSKNNRGRYIFKAENKNELQSFLNNHQNRMKNIIINIFESLFGDNKHLHQSSIQWTDKYVNYMCFGVPLNKVSDFEFSIMINSKTNDICKDGMKSIIRRWCQSQVYKKDSDSIRDQFIRYRINNNSYDNIVRLIYALFYWLEFDTVSKNKLIIAEIANTINSLRSQDKYSIEFHNLLINKLNDLIERKYYEKVAALCSEIYKYATTQKAFLLSEYEVKSLLTHNIYKLLSSKNWDPINLVENDGNKLNKVFSLSVVQDLQSSRNPVAGDVIEWFRLKNIKSRHIDRLKQKFNTYLTNNEVLGSRRKSQEEELAKLFGTANPDLYLEDFKIHCFVS